MATIVDALVITLGLDPTDYEKGAKRATKAHKDVTESVTKGTKEIAAESKGAAQAISQLRSDAIALLAVFLGGRGFKDFVQDIGFGDAALARMARTTKMSTSELSAWKSMADMAGGSGDDLIGTLQGLSDQYNQWQLTGESSIAPALRALQEINPALRLDNNGQMADLGQFLLQLSDTVKNMPAGRARSLLGMLGIDSNTINVILQGRAAMEGYLKASKALQGPVEQSAIAGKELQAAWAQTDLAMRGVGRTLLLEIAPALIEVLHLVRDFALWAQDHPKLIAAGFWLVTAAVVALSVALSVNLARLALVQTAAGFSILIGLIPKLLLGLAVLTETALPALSEGFLALGATIEATPIGWILTGIAAVAGAAYLIYDNWSTIKGWWHDLWGSMGIDVKKVNDILRTAAEMALLTLPGGSGLAFQMMAEDAKAGGGGGSVGHASGPVHGAAPGGAGSSDMVTLKTASGKTYQVNKQYAAQFAGFVAELESRGYKINSIGGYSDRNIAGTDIPSFHAQGAAIDINPGSNPVNGGRTDLPSDVAAIAAKYGLGWGGNWKSKKDPMHFSVAASEGGSARLVHLPRAHHAVQARSGNVNNSKTVHSDTRIGSVIVNTPATDGPGVARDIHAELSTHGLAVQANSGLA